MHFGRREDVGCCAGRWREAEQAAAVAGTPAFAPVTVDGRLQLTWRAQAFPLTFIRVEVFHVPKIKHSSYTTSTEHTCSTGTCVVNGTVAVQMRAPNNCLFKPIKCLQ